MPLNASFVRYLAVGALATGLHYALLVALVELAHWPPWLGSGAGAIAGAQLAFAGNRWFTFGHRGPWAAAWVRFHLTAVTGALLGMAVVALAVQWGVHYVIGQLAATGAAALLTYAVNRGWTFAATPGRG